MDVNSVTGLSSAATFGAAGTQRRSTKGRGEMIDPGSRRRRVFVVDDHPIVRQGLVQLIEQEPDLEVCGEAADVTEARLALAKI